MTKFVPICLGHNRKTVSRLVATPGMPLSSGVMRVSTLVPSMYTTRPSVECRIPSATMRGHLRNWITTLLPLKQRMNPRNTATAHLMRVQRKSSRCSKKVFTGPPPSDSESESNESELGGSEGVRV